MKTLPKLSPFLFIILLVCLIMPLAIHAYMGTFSRLTADDYCTAYGYREFGVGGYIVNNYITWSGRYSAAALGALTASFGAGIAAYSTTIILLVWFTVSFLAFAQIPFSKDKKKKYGTAVLLSAAIMVTVLGVTPNINQSLYWINGMDALIPSFICSTAYFGGVLHITQREDKNNWRLYIEYALCFLLPLIAGGFHEVYALLQVIALFIALMAALVFWQNSHRKKALFIFSLSLSGALMALAVVFFAPGNSVRSAFFPPHPTLINILKISFASVRQFYFLIITYTSRIGYTIWLLILSSVLGMAYARNVEKSIVSSKFSKTLLFLLPVISFFLVFICFIPGAYAVSYSIPERTMVIPVFVIEVSLAAWGFTWGSVYLKGIVGEQPKQNRSERWIMLTLLIFIAIIPIYGSTRILKKNPQLITYAAQWDTMNTQIVQEKKSGANQVVVLAQTDWAGLDGIRSDPQFWVNICVSKYYGLQVSTK